MAKGLKGMENSPKLYCEIWGGVICSSNCLLEMGQVVDQDKTCQRCLYYLNVKLREELRSKIKENFKGLFYISQTLAQRLNRSERLITYLARQGKIPFKRIGRIYLFEKNEVEDWIAEQRRNPKWLALF
jgi:excisionase family DNA binding protein